MGRRVGAESPGRTRPGGCEEDTELVASQGLGGLQPGAAQSSEGDGSRVRGRSGQGSPGWGSSNPG